MGELLETVASFAPNYRATLGMGALCAYLGMFTVLRRIVFTGAALAQAAAAGVAASFWAATLPLPGFLHGLVSSWGATVGSLAASVGSALGLSGGGRRGRLTADARVGVVFAGASALSVLLVWRSSSGLVELKNILAGDVLLSSSGDMLSLWLGIVGVAAIHVFLRARFLLVAYDPPFARAQGLDVPTLERVFLASLAVAVAVALRVAGLMLVFGTLVLPPLVGLRAAGTLSGATRVAVAAAWTSALCGFLLATQLDLPVAPSIVLFEVALLAGAMVAPRAVEVASLVGGVLAVAVGVGLGAYAPAPVDAPREASAPSHQRAGDHAHHRGHTPGDGHDHRPRSASEQALDDAVATLTDLARSDLERAQAAGAIADLGRGDGVPPLLAAMSDPVPEVAAAARDAAVALGSKHGAPRIARLVALAEGPDAEIATHAARVLVELRHEGAWVLLVERLAEASVPILLREETHAFLTAANGGDGLGYDAFAGADANADALRAWRAWAEAR